MRASPAAALLVFLVLPASAAPDFERGAGPAFVTRACPTAMDAPATCGTVSVPENYAAPSGKRIALHVVVFKASKPGKERAAQFDLEGGPGFAVTDSAVFYAKDGAGYRETRDVVLFDMRGTGGSNALRCGNIEAYERANPLAPMYPPDLVRECAAQLSKRADLRQYSTANASRDIESVRRALGYSRIDLNALSYGTTLALRYIADYPSRVRTAVLTGTVPAARTPPRFHAPSAERGLATLFDACAADADCAVRYPRLAEQLDQALARMEPEVRPAFLEKIRARLYMPASSRGVPALIHQAAAGDLSALRAPPAEARVFADGVYLSITCSESFARMDIDAGISDARATRFGPYRLLRQREACAQWPASRADTKLFTAARSAVPVLFVSGAFDPVTPPRWADELAPMFPNGKHLLIPQGAHTPEGLSGMDTCLDEITLRFVAKGSANGLDTACVSQMRAGPFS